MVHFSIFDFFVNLMSILDRLAYEINLLYELGDWVEENMDWLKLTNPKNRFLCCLNVKDKKLAGFIKAQKTSFAQVPAYRNRLIHDSIISTRIERVDSPFKFQVFLPQKPTKQKSKADVDLIRFCEKAKVDILNLLDESYRLMLQHYQNYGRPPW